MYKLKYKSPIERNNDEANGDLRPFIAVNEAIKNETEFILFLDRDYQSYTFDDGRKEKAAILDGCPACGGNGLIPTIAKHNLYGELREYSESEACPYCKTGEDKYKRLYIPYQKFSEKPICFFVVSCPITSENNKQKKCFNCRCKFDKELKNK